MQPVSELAYPTRQGAYCGMRRHPAVFPTAGTRALDPIIQGNHARTGIQTQRSDSKPSTRSIIPTMPPADCSGLPYPSQK